MLATPAGRFRVIAVAEALSWLGLLVGMYVKHVADASEVGVKVFGPIHGVIFIGYVVLTVLLARQRGWDRKLTLLGLAASIPPFATLLFEQWASRTGKLAEAQQD